MIYILIILYIVRNSLSKSKTFVDTLLTSIYIRNLLGVNLGNRFLCNGIPFIDFHPLSNVTLGSNLVLTSRSANNMLGVGNRSIIKVFPNAFLSIGNRVGISSARISCTHSIFIGDDVLIGADTLIIDSDAHPLHKSLRNDPTEIKSAPIIIESNVFIGTKCIILKGSVIKDGAVIGAGSVVSGIVMADSVYVGNPAVFKKGLAV